MAYDTLIQQGRFTSTGVNVYIPLRGGVDWFETYNQTQIGAAGAGQGVRFWWQNGMGTHSFVMEKTAVTSALTLVDVSPGLFTLVDQSNPLVSPLLGAPVATTAESNAVQPVVTTANTAGLSTGSVVRLSNVAAIPNLMGFDFEIDTVNANANFRMRFPLANVPGAVGGAGFYRQVNFNSPFYPQNRYIVDITNANPMVVSLSVTCDYQVGQQIRFNIPNSFGMVQLNGLVGTITQVANNSMNINIDSTAFNAFVIPAIALYPFTWAQCVPVGEDTSVALALNANILSDATVNQELYGMILAAGATGPAGQAADVIYWRAGKSFSVINL